MPIASIAFTWKVVSLPSMEPERGSVSGSVLQILRRRPIAWGMAAVSLFFMGQFTLFTYLRPFLETVTHVGASTLSLLLLGMGVAGFVGTTVIGKFLKESLHLTLIVIPALMAMIAVALISFGSSVVLAAILLGIWGLITTVGTGGVVDVAGSSTPSRGGDGRWFDGGHHSAGHRVWSHYGRSRVRSERLSGDLWA